MVHPEAQRMGIGAILLAATCYAAKSIMSGYYLANSISTRWHLANGFTELMGRPTARAMSSFHRESLQFCRITGQMEVAKVHANLIKYYEYFAHSLKNRQLASHQPPIFDGL
jgi:tRNA(Met) C34 N-acetyltransferase TmcA